MSVEFDHGPRSEGGGKRVVKSSGSELVDRGQGIKGRGECELVDSTHARLGQRQREREREAEDEEGRHDGPSHGNCHRE